MRRENMHDNIKAQEKSLDSIFSGNYVFSVPSYQRPYSWTKDNAAELFDDLFDAYQNKTSEDDSYFLGSLVLKKDPYKPNSDIIDGQQRLTTLTILLAILRDQLSSSIEFNVFSKDLHSRIFKSDQISAAKDLYLLTLRNKDEGFFCKYIKEEGATSKLIDLKKEVDSRARIIENRNILWEKLFKLSDNDKYEFAKFIMNNCYLVVVETPNEESAFRIFSVLNARGLSLTVADLLKAELISSIPVIKQDRFTQDWEGFEKTLGRSDFTNLFSYIRMIYAKTKLRKTLLKEFHEYVIDVKNENSKAPFKDAEDFIDNALDEYVDAYDQIKNCSYIGKNERDTEEINRYFKYLNRLDNSDWLPPAIEVMKYYQYNDKFILKFFEKLERFAYGQFILRTMVNNRIAKYGELLKAIQKAEKESQTDVIIDALKLSYDDKVQIKDILDGDIYDKPAIRLPLLLRLDEFLSTGSATYDYKTISIEHVLPQTSDNIESWTQAFPDEEVRAKWVNKLANLVLLNGRTNSSAQNYDFETKKEKYFKTKNGNISGVTNFALTSQVTQESEWTPEVLEKRQQKLLSAFDAIWDLNSEDS